MTNYSEATLIRDEDIFSDDFASTNVEFTVYDDNDLAKYIVVYTGNRHAEAMFETTRICIPLLIKKFHTTSVTEEIQHMQRLVLTETERFLIECLKDDSLRQAFTDNVAHHWFGVPDDWSCNIYHHDEFKLVPNVKSPSVRRNTLYLFISKGDKQWTI